MAPSISGFVRCHRRRETRLVPVVVRVLKSWQGSVQQTSDARRVNYNNRVITLAARSAIRSSHDR